MESALVEGTENDNVHVRFWIRLFVQSSIDIFRKGTLECTV